MSILGNLLDKLRKRGKGENDTGDVLQTSEDRVSARRNRILAIAIGAVGIVLLSLSLKELIVPLFWKKDTLTEQRRLKLLESPKGATQREMTGSMKLEDDWRTVLEGKVKDQEGKISQVDTKLDAVLQKLDEKEKKDREPRRMKKEEYPEKSLRDVAPIPVPASGNRQMYPPQAPQAVQQPKPAAPQQPAFKSIEFKFDGKQQSKNMGGSEDTIDLPIGLAVGITLTGMDAPTFQWGQQDPQPLLVSLESEMITAMGGSMDVKGCMLLASAHGSVSAEKAMPRAVKMDCRDKKGVLYTGQVKGWVLGDDGKVGMTGRLVSRQGTALAKSFWADVLSLGGSYLRAKSTTTAISPLGATETIKDNELLQAAGGQVVERSTGRISQFLIKIAEQIYPVVEVMPGRKVTVLFEGARLRRVRRDNFEDEQKIAQKETGNTAHEGNRN